MTESRPTNAPRNKQTGDTPAATITDISPAQAEVDTIIQGARKEGSITNADLAEKLGVLDLNADETDAVYQRLVELGVDVV
jgi:ribosome-binding protein aMBF1 (putative translation factor)